MKIIDLSIEHTSRIEEYSSIGAHVVKLADGHGDSHAYFLRFEANSIIGEHEAGFGQLFFVVDGSGWVAGADGVRVHVHTGQAAVFERGELHSKGSDPGMTAIIVQMRNFVTA